ncbi:nucleophile aminohydrolase [Podospora aff. communis PSN243]|uniref:Nucleophile aminohydrolase n=1 Tax=Podospora aff. communis PSN243 TaxID=3040156 RepID=A0AAV9GZM8_9PEZI|nr:nucleophile aminohydrolase [Podospora aff. communis PSN243]
MEYKPQHAAAPAVKPRLIIHGGAGNITPASLSPDRYKEYRDSLLTIVSKTHTYMHTPCARNDATHTDSSSSTFPTALETATFAVVLLEDNPLFNSAHGAVFTRDGLIELEASVMVSRGHAKRAVGVMGLRRVRNPILLARRILEHGDVDLAPKTRCTSDDLNVPSAQGHSQLHGAAAERLAERYGLKMVKQSYFCTPRRWAEHVRGLEREREGNGPATWSAEEYLPQGTCGAVALDAEGVTCCATSTGGLTNKLTGRIGDTPTVGAGFWAEEWTEQGDPTGRVLRQSPGPSVVLSESLRGLVADCFPSPFVYAPVPNIRPSLVTTRSVAVSGTGNGDSFLRTAAARTVGSIARFSARSSAEAVTKVTGPSGELQRSAGDRWGRTGEGEGGIIGIESVVVRDDEGKVVETRSDILQDFNCGGMFRAWIDGQGVAFARVWRNDSIIPDMYVGEAQPEDPRLWAGDKQR